MQQARRKHPGSTHHPIKAESGTHSKKSTFLGSTHGCFLRASFCCIINRSQCILVKHMKPLGKVFLYQSLKGCGENVKKKIQRTCFQSQIAQLRIELVGYRASQCSKMLEKVFREGTNLTLSWLLKLTRFWSFRIQYELGIYHLGKNFPKAYIYYYATDMSE